MRGRPQTLTAIVREAVEAWRKRERWSIATVVQCIVEAHERIGADVLTELRFDSDRDAVRRMQTNGERVYRWLDDVTKHSNYLPPNFLPSIMAALPMDLRIECADRFLFAAGLAVRPLEGECGHKSVVTALQVVAKESGEATAAVAALVDGATPEELRVAQRELTESIAAQQSALSDVESMMAGDSFARRA